MPLVLALGVFVQTGCSRESGTPPGSLSTQDFGSALPPASAATLATHRTKVVACDVEAAVEWRSLSSGGSRYVVGYRIDVVRSSPHTIVRDDSVRPTVSGVPPSAHDEHRIVLSCDERRWWGSVHDTVTLDVRADGSSLRHGR